MAKQTKKAKRTKRRSTTLAVLPPSEEDFKRARDLLRQRSAALILDLAKRYVATKAAELTTVLDAIDSLAEFERMSRAAVGASGLVSAEPAKPASQAAENGAGRPTLTTGTVKWFNTQKGFGFIVNTASGKDVFVHMSAVEKAGLTKLNEGQQIEFELEENRGKATAVNLKLK